MPATNGRPPRDGQAYRAWVNPPADASRELTHAVDPGGTVALCGIRTTVSGGPWPSDRSAWDPRSTRCGVCARQVYGRH